MHAKPWIIPVAAARLLFHVVNKRLIHVRQRRTHVQKQQLSLPCIYCTHGHAWRSGGLLAYAGPGIAAQAARRRRDDDGAEQFRDRSKLPLERLWIVWAASEPRSQGKAAAADEDDGRQLDQD